MRKFNICANWMCVLIMSHTRYRVNLHSAVAELFAQNKRDISNL